MKKTQLTAEQFKKVPPDKIENKIANKRKKRHKKETKVDKTKIAQKKSNTPAEKTTTNDGVKNQTQNTTQIFTEKHNIEIETYVMYLTEHPDQIEKISSELNYHEVAEHTKEYPQCLAVKMARYKYDIKLENNHTSKFDNSPNSSTTLELTSKEPQQKNSKEQLTSTPLTHTTKKTNKIILHEEMSINLIADIVTENPPENIEYKDTSDLDHDYAQNIQNEDTQENPWRKANGERTDTNWTIPHNMSPTQNVTPHTSTPAPINETNIDNNKNYNIDFNTETIANTTQKQTTTPSRSNSSHTTIQIIVDNIKDRHTKTEKEIETQLYKDFTLTHNIKFDIKYLKKGGIIITPKIAHLEKNTAFTHKNTLLKTDKYSTEFFGKRLNIKPLSPHMPKTKWLCIPKINIDENIDDIEKQLEKIEINSPTHEIKITGLHRQMKGTYPTKLLKFTVDNEIQYNTLINKTIQTKYTTTKIQPYIDTTTIRCTHCQNIGHLARACPKKNQAHICVRCAGNCPLGKCQRTHRRCANCQQPHAASYKNCPILKQHTQANYQINKQKTWAQITAQNTQDFNQLHNQQQQINNSQNDIITTLKNEFTTNLNKIKQDIETIQTANVKLTTDNIELTQQMHRLQEEIKTLRKNIETSIANQPTRIHPLLDNYIDKKSLHSILFQTATYRANTNANTNTNASANINKQIDQIINRTLQNTHKERDQERMNKTANQINNSRNV